MNSQPDFDLVSANRLFAAHCFNSAWEFIDRTDRTTEDDEQMIRAAHASLWHWTQKPVHPAQMHVSGWPCNDGAFDRRYPVIRVTLCDMVHSHRTVSSTILQGIMPFTHFSGADT